MLYKSLKGAASIPATDLVPTIRSVGGGGEGGGQEWVVLPLATSHRELKSLITNHRQNVLG